ncbi:MAG: cbb3-type cytochrome c oxidase subunit I [Saprospiraceae bacterium]|nr:cbb3-type cytochrome c oxidase subunit I [Saprospiraceae bacterium]
MSPADQHIGKRYLATALVLLCLGLIFGLMAGIFYLFPGFGNYALDFRYWRPMHVSAVVFWIILGATGCVYSGLDFFQPLHSPALARLQWYLWLFAIVGIYYSYLKGDFGGREYWEFNPVWALPIALAWLLFLVNFIKSVRKIAQWPVYVWMWMTGLLFFLFSFTENYLWVFPYFREHFVTDTTIQWKVNGSLVGAWNQLLYGTAFFLMARISKNSGLGHSRLAFGMYFLGLFNLMFNWGHHIYTLPTDTYVRYTGYMVSMTEWVFFARIVYNWRQSVTDIQKHYYHFPYRFLMAADIWVLINLSQAIMMSIPAVNLYTHGTHVTVAHAMGTTIGINTMILLAACFEFLIGKNNVLNASNKWLNGCFWVIQAALFIFWLSLNIAGVKKGIWQMSEPQLPFSKMMESLKIWFSVFVGSGVILATALFTLGFVLLRFQWTVSVSRKRVVDSKE